MTDLHKPIVNLAEIEYSTDLPAEVLQKIIDFAAGVDANVPGRGAGSAHLHNRFDYVPTVRVSFLGDVTGDPNWQAKLGRFVADSRFASRIASNFDRELEDRDLLALTCVHQIRIRIDSSSPAVMQQLRSTDLRAIIANVVRLRQAMLETGKKPELDVDCTVTEKNLAHLGGVARLTSILQVDVLNIGDALGELNDAQVRLLARSVIDAVNALKGTRTTINILPGLKRKLEPVFVAISEGKPVSAALFQQAETERTHVSPCTQPWNTAIVQATGSVRLCHGPLEPVGDIHDDSLINIVNGFSARKARAFLLDGAPNLPCRSCSLSTSDTAEVFLQRIREAHERYDTSIYPWQASVPTGMNYDAEHGITTQARIFVNDLDAESVGAALEHATPYIPSPATDIDRILDAVPLAPEHCTLIDLGCGMGRVVLHAAKRPYRQIVGVEVSPALLDIAKKNLAAYNGPLACRNIVLVCADAAQYTFPAGDIVVYMFNPFTDAILKPVLDRLSRHDGKVVIAYGAPVHAGVIDANPRFGLVSQLALSDPRNAARVWQSHSPAC